MKKKLPITKNKDVVVSWVYTWSKQQDMSIHEQRIVLRILEACQAELKGVKLKDYAGTKRKFEHKSCPPIEMAFLVQVLLVYRMESSSSLLVEIRQILLFLFWLLQTLHYP